MNPETHHTLSNSFLAVRLIALREFPLAADQGAGPFLVIQSGFDPASLEVEPQEFVLTREGLWVRLTALEGLGWERGRDLFFFPVASEVMELLGRLPPKPQIGALPPEPEDGPGTAGGVGEAGDGGFHEAMVRAIRDAHPT